MAGREVFVFDAIRTPRGRGSPRRGALREIRPIALVRGLMQALGQRHDLPPDAVDDVLLGCVTQTGEQGANLAKIAALYAGWDARTGGATINRFCASGLDAVRLAAAGVAVGEHALVVAGGVESMSRVPMFDDRGPWFSDPDVAERTGFVHMTVAADLLARRLGLDRAALDGVAVRSHARAAAAEAEGRFSASRIPVRDDEGTVVLDRDELVRPGLTAESMAALPPLLAEAADEDLRVARAFDPELAPLHHVGVSPGIADGAALVLLGTEEAGRRHGLSPRARCVAFASTSVDPVLMLHGNVLATRQALARAGRRVDEVDLFEVGESFAVVPLHFGAELDVDLERIDVNGGAIAQGHPLGASGSILVSMAIDELHRRGATTAVVSLCGGAGMAVSAVLERA